jgi:hypothetical protein
MKTKYFIRHKILEYLFQEASKEEDPQSPLRLITSTEISDKTKISLNKINLFHEILHERGEIKCYSDRFNHEMNITIKGRQSFLDRSYLIEGREAFWNSIYNPLKIIIPSLTLILAVIALVLSQGLKKDLKSTQDQVDSLKIKIENYYK